MSVENWKLWLVPFAAWIVVMSWQSGYHSGYQEGHQEAWHMSRPRTTFVEDEIMLKHAASQLNDRRLVKR
jgi:hypothetical protein